MKTKLDLLIWALQAWFHLHAVDWHGGFGKPDVCEGLQVGGAMHGSEARNKEKARLRKGIHVLVCTPGRLLDHLQHTEAFRTADLGWLVLDDVDQILQTDACSQLGEPFHTAGCFCSCTFAFALLPSLLLERENNVLWSSLTWTLVSCHMKTILVAMYACVCTHSCNLRVCLAQVRCKAKILLCCCDVELPCARGGLLGMCTSSREACWSDIFLVCRSDF